MLKRPQQLRRDSLGSSSNQSRPVHLVKKVQSSGPQQHFKIAHIVTLNPLYNYRDLTRLNLGKNNLHKIPSNSLKKLAYLEILEMSENHIADIEVGAFEGKTTEFVICVRSMYCIGRQSCFHYIRHYGR